jgi:hypothetical protein
LRRRFGTHGAGGYNLLVGRDNSRFRPLESLFLYGLAGAAAILLLAGFIGGLLIRRALLSEVHRIRQTTCAIVEGDFSRRLPARGGSDELDFLAQTVNRMLDQIEQLVHGVRNVSNAIAHDLRTRWQNYAPVSKSCRWRDPTRRRRSRKSKPRSPTWTG